MTLLAKAQTLVSEGYTVTVDSADGTCTNNAGEAIASGTGSITFTVTKDGTDITANTNPLEITVRE